MFLIIFKYNTQFFLHKYNNIIIYIIKYIYIARERHEARETNIIIINKI